MARSVARPRHARVTGRYDGGLRGLFHLLFGGWAFPVFTAILVALVAVGVLGVRRGRRR